MNEKFWYQKLSLLTILLFLRCGNKLNIVITGGAGFIGTHLVEKFLEKSHNVIVVDNLLTGLKANLDNFTKSKKFSFIDLDVQNHIEIEGEVDYVLHLASAASPKAYTDNPINTLKAGSIGTINTLGLAKAKHAKYLLTSTSEVYGDPEISPQPESYWGRVNPNGVRSMYDEAKRFAEAAVSSYNRIYNIDSRIVRLFNTYGPKMKINDGRVVTNFIVQALNGEDITIYGKGNQTRSFCYVSDTVAGIIKAMDSESNEVFNIGNPNEITILQLAEIIIQLTESKSGVKYQELPDDDPTQRKPDIGKAINILDWKPDIGLEEGLNKTIGWVKANLN
ncbi:SDR family oxidoreductase [Candidatus Actinomarina]|nr:SDR family oxidoreductase [Candidatus Actinomarina sp.]